MTKIQELLDEVIEKEIGNLNNDDSLDSEEKSEAIKNLAALHKLHIDEIKAQTEADEKNARRVMDSEQYQTELALKQREADGKDADRSREEANLRRQNLGQAIERYAKIGLSVAELVLPLVFYGIWMNMGFEFEKTGSFTSTTFKNLVNRFRATK